MNKKLLSIATWALLIVFVVTAFAACATDEHTCNHVCETCGGCTDADCKDEVCANKCEGHLPEDPYADESVLTNLDVRSATGSNGVTAAANPYASKAGLDILRMGGNAFDAGVAIAFALGVVEPAASGVGGGGVMTGYDAETGEYIFVNYREFVPANQTLAATGAAGLNLDNGIGAAGVPTMVAGMCTIVERYGSGNVTLADILAPAINLAENGFKVTKELASSFDSGYPTFVSNNIESALNNFTDGIQTLREGEVCTQPEYANVLKEIASKGRDGFYKGWVADAIVEKYTEKGGFVTYEDLTYASTNYPKIGKPLSTKYNGYDIYTANVPSSGGIILIETLNMLTHYCDTNATTLKALREKSELEYVHVVATAMQLAAADKRHYIADNDINPATGEAFVNVPITGLSSKEYAAQRWDALYNAESAIPLSSSYDWGGAARGTQKAPWGGSYALDKSPWDYNGTTAAAYGIDENEDDNGTTSFFAADSHGNIAGFTQTINHFWGAYEVPEGCGFFLNNQLSSFSDTATNAGGSVHYLAPYKQPVSHIMPTIVMKDGSPVATFGSPGSTRIPSAVTQVCLNVLAFDMGMQEAIDAHRFYNWSVSQSDHQPILSAANPAFRYNNTKLIEMEVGGYQKATIDGLNSMHYYVNEYSEKALYFGGVQGIMFNYDANGNLVSMTGGADPRRDGKALAY